MLRDRRCSGDDSRRTPISGRKWRISISVFDRTPLEKFYDGCPSPEDFPKQDDPRLAHWRDQYIEIGSCSNCKRPARAKRINTAYVHDNCNFVMLCNFCYEMAEESINDMWIEYNNARYS